MNRQIGNNEASVIETIERVISKSSRLAGPYSSWVSEHQETVKVVGFNAVEADILGRVIGVKASLYTTLDASANEIFPYEDVKLYAERSEKLLKLAIAKAKESDNVSMEAKQEINAHIQICKGLLSELLVD